MLAYIFISVFIVAFGAAHLYRISQADSPQSSTVATSQTKVTTDELYVSTNEVRKENGLPQFIRDTKLDDTAQKKCNDMVTNNYYEHKNPTTNVLGTQYMADVFQYHNGISENLNKGIFSSSEAVVSSWMNSEPHMKAILNNSYTHIGFATCINKNQPHELIVVQHMMSPYVESPTKVDQ